MNIENKKQLATILLAVGLGLVASMLMSKVVNDKVEQQTRLIAKEFGGKSAALVKEVDTNKKRLSKQNKEIAALKKRISQQPTVQQVAPKSKKPVVQKSAFALRTPPGKRALTLKIESLAAVGGLINAGDFVDIIAHLNVPDPNKAKSKQKIITVLFQNIQVLAVGTNFDPVGDVPPYQVQQQRRTLNITFSVNPEEAGLLAFSQANGKLQLSLRSPTESQDKILQEVASWDALADFVLERQGTELRIPKKKVEVKTDSGKIIEEAEEKPYIQIFRGGHEL